MTTPGRAPAGVPTGGQFTASARAEATVDLGPSDHAPVPVSYVLAGPVPHTGTCRRCLKHGDVYAVGRAAPRTPRTAGRRQVTSICGDCAVTLLAEATGDAGGTVRRFSTAALARIAGVLSTDEAQDALAGFEERRAEARRLREEWRSRLDEDQASA